MSCPAVSAEPFAALIVARPGPAKHGRLRAWPLGLLYIRVRDQFGACEENRVCGKCAGNATLGCTIVSSRGALAPSAASLGA